MMDLSHSKLWATQASVRTADWSSLKGRVPRPLWFEIHFKSLL